MTNAALERQKPTNGERGTATLMSRMPHLVSSTSAPKLRTRKRATTRLRLPQGEPDLEALKAVIDDWLVPLLAKEFLAEYSTRGGRSEAEEGAKTEVPRERKRTNAKQ